MKIVAINGSHRGKSGYTQFLINKLFEGAQKAGAQCETIVLAEHHINRCLGCRVCHTQNSYLKCVYEKKDDVDELFKIMRTADVLVYATPIYIFTMSGLMKTFLDRLTSTGDSSIMALSKAGLFFHPIDEKLTSKPFVLLTCQDNFESETHKNVVSYFKTFSKFMDAPLVGVLVRTSGSLVGHGTMPEREARYPKIRFAYETLIRAGAELVNKGVISRATERSVNQLVIDIPKPIQLLLRLSCIRRNRRVMNKIFQKAVNQQMERTAI